METIKQKFKSCVTFAPGSKPLISQSKWMMPGVIESWKRDERITEREIEDLFLLSDIPSEMSWLTGKKLDVMTDFYPPYPEEVLEETEEYVVRRNSLGGVEKLMKQYAYMPMPIEYPLKNRKDWSAMKERLVWDAGRLPGVWQEKAHKHSQEGWPLTLFVAGFYGFPRELLGDEALCLLYYDDPALIHDIANTYSLLLRAVRDAINESGISIDKIIFWEDLAGNAGPIIGPSLFREFIKRYYQEIIPEFKQIGVYHFEVDTDGNFDLLIPDFLESGVTCLFPFEVHAGMDIVSTRQRYPSLVIHGGIDKRVLTEDIAAIDAELEKKLPLMIETGGYLCTTDHRIMLGSSYKNVLYFMKRLKDFFS
jgi:hypothetical protein